MQAMNKAILNIVTALDCEAHALIAHFKLVKIAVPNQFNVYCNAQGSIYLIVSGMGRVNAAAATAFLYAHSGAQPQTCFLNIGIAGHRDFDLAEIFLIHKVTDMSCRKSWYPFLPKKTALNTADLQTVDTVMDGYPEQALQDMEGSAFFQAASCFVDHEQVSLLKIISDNQQQDTQAINKAKVKLWFEHNISQIDAIVMAFLNRSQQESVVAARPDLTEYLEKWHFTHYQQHQLREYLRRWQVLSDEPFIEKVAQATSAKTVLKTMQQSLTNLAYTWP